MPQTPAPSWTSTASKDLEAADSLATTPRALTLYYHRARAFSPSPLKTRSGPMTLGAAIAVKKGVKTAADAAECHRRGPAGLLHPRLRCGSAPGGPGPRQPGRHAPERRRPSASLSWPAMSPLPPPKAPSASPATPTRCARTPLQRHPQRPGQGRRHDHQPHQRLHLRARPSTTTSSHVTEAHALTIIKETA